MPSPIVRRLGARALSSFVLVLAVSARPARAEQPAARPQPSSEELVLRTRLYDASKTGRWQEVVESFVALRARGLGDEPGLLLRYAEAQATLKETAAATTAAEAVLARAADDVRGLLLLGRLRQQAGRVDEARELFVRAARAGGNVLRELTPDALAELLRGSGAQGNFVLRVMTASQGVEVGRPARDPFAAPALDDDVIVGGDGPAPPSAVRLALEREVDALLERIALLAERGDDVAGFGAALKELQALLTRWEGLGADVARDRLEACRARFESLRDVHDGLRLQVALHEANGLLRHMGRLLAEDAPDDALVVHRQVVEVANRLQGDSLLPVVRVGEALRLRAEPLLRKARALSRIARLNLEVTGVVLPPPGEGPATAIVDDRIRKEGERIELDDVEVRVVAIRRSAVRFALDEFEFVRPLRLPK